MENGNLRVAKDIKRCKNIEIKNVKNIISKLESGKFLYDEGYYVKIGKKQC